MLHDDFITNNSKSVNPFPILMRMATKMEDPQGVPQNRVIYDRVSQVSHEIIGYDMSSERTGCTKATRSTPMIGKDPEGDYAADDV